MTASVLPILQSSKLRPGQGTKLAEGQDQNPGVLAQRTPSALLWSVSRLTAKPGDMNFLFPQQTLCGAPHCAYRATEKSHSCHLRRVALDGRRDQPERGGTARCITTTEASAGQKQLHRRGTEAPGDPARPLCGWRGASAPGAQGRGGHTSEPHSTRIRFAKSDLLSDRFLA